MVFMGRINDRLAMVFKMYGIILFRLTLSFRYDFDDDGLISREDVRLMLTYMNTAMKNSDAAYRPQDPAIEI